MAFSPEQFLRDCAGAMMLAAEELLDKHHNDISALEPEVRDQLLNDWHDLYYLISGDTTCTLPLPLPRRVT